MSYTYTEIRTFFEILTRYPGMILYVKNMKSTRCKTLVRSEMNKLGVHEMTVELGEVELLENLSEENLQLLANGLRNTGLELVEDKNTQLIKKIKAAVYQLVSLVSH